MIESPLPTLPAWVKALADAEIPVLPHTVAELRQLREIEDARGTVDASMLADALSADPLMTLKVLVHVSRYCTRLSVEPPESLTGAIVMLGITPFFNTFNEPPTVIDWLNTAPDAISGLLKVVTRARRSAHFAMSFALRRQDEDAAIVHQAALLHDFAEMLLWCHAPKLAQEMAQRLQTDHTLRSAAVQKVVLGMPLSAVAHELMRVWQLPDMLIKCTDDRRAQDPQVRSVMLGVRIARHTQHGWDSPHAQAALHDDVSDVAKLLTLSHEVAERLLKAIDS
ncbi:HDOD domain-containing protein [Aquabacterium sp.]|jgi:HD-like signal output (HDOD) protein|uniref:HDOD domain-containing protein n=1 Tax=Aquabacterium sp. TaxID=1872578 RepID=UPI0027BAD1D0|nr:HDOD domain-containing protein [Aquabacterium sp.]